MSRAAFFLSEAFRALRRSAAPSIAAIVTIVVTTLLLGVLVPVLKASEDKAQDVRDQIGLNVFLFNDATREEIDQLRAELEVVPHIEGVDFVSRQEAIDVLTGRLDKDLAGSLEELNSNPLPPSFTIDLDDPSNLGAVTSAITKTGPSGERQPISPIIDEVQDARQDAGPITEITGKVKWVLIILAVLLLVSSVMLVGNTIRLSIYARRREVEVMRLVGATNWFVRWPFIIEGVIVGLSGSLVAVAILWLGKVVAVDPLSETFDLVDSFATVDFTALVVALVVSAMIVSALGSGITLRRFLRI
ncbi:MAG: permease-like cell division protein FtsX [Actinomycetota bacterium]|nr:permease-like cell division protein FtsX [Actinomycetota bacterium]